jgi:23S rRNA (cytosine1962-C5)-methyltransferase
MGVIVAHRRRVVVDHARVDDYELLDVGDGMRLERFGARVVARPHPVAAGHRERNAPWREATLTFEPERGWTGRDVSLAWEMRLAGLTVELRATPSGQVGAFPEQAAVWEWLRDRVTPGAAVLNLFAYTGIATLVAAAAGASVVHVDASRPTIAWARRNAELSGLADRPIRWIVEDAVGFVSRELRRGRRYVGVVLDPPSYGHAAGGRAWRLQDDLAPLIDRCADLVRGLNGFVLLTAHTPGFSPERLAFMLGEAFDASPAGMELGPLFLRSATGRELDLGSFARWPGTRS